MPNDGKKLNLIAARAFLISATPLKNQFVEFGLPADFLEDLQTDITDFEQAVTEKNAATGEKISATASIGNAVKSGPEGLHRLLTIVTEQIPRQPGKTRRVDKCQLRWMRSKEKTTDTAESLVDWKMKTDIDQFL